MKHLDPGEGDTVVALSTPPGRSGIGVVRVSGPQAIAILKKIFIPKMDSEFLDRIAVYGSVIDPAARQVLDDGMAVVMRGPKSYTGEDVAELSLHGSPVVLDLVVRLIISQGARLAQRGEFTRRAFLSGKLDLIQAEAVIDLIDAKTPTAAVEARRSMETGVGAAVEDISNSLKDILATIQAHIDFDEDEETGPPDVESSIRAVLGRIEALKSYAEVSRIRREGIFTVIVGKPNVGKSTLFNVLLKTERTIVTPYPGTTRDPVDDCLILGGNLFVLWDTAGIRKNPDPVEEEGIRRTTEKINQADLVLAVLDASEPLDEEDARVLAWCKQKKTVVVLNKVDLVRTQRPGGSAEEDAVNSHVAISAKTGQGIKVLEKMLNEIGQRMIVQDSLTQGPGLNSRCLQLIEAASLPIRRVLTLMNGPGNVPEDILSYELRSAVDPLEEITGERADDGLLERIFERFCVGK